MNKLKELIEESRLRKTDFSTILPSLYEKSITKWTVKWDRKKGAVNVDFSIIK